MARQRTVFGSHANLAHVWAQRSYPYGRASDGRMSFDGDSIYSYGSHYTIARFHVPAEGRDTVVLFNANRYSPSTGKHRSLTLGALNGLPFPIYEVDRPQDHDQRHNLACLIAAFDTLAGNMRNMRKMRKSLPEALWARKEAVQREACQVFQFAEVMGLPEPDLDLDAKLEAIDAAWWTHHDPAKVAKRDKARARREAKAAREAAPLLARVHAFLEDAGPHLEPGEVSDIPNSQRELRDAYLSKAQRLDRAYYPERYRFTTQPLTVAEWLDGKGSSYAHLSDAPIVYSAGIYGGPSSETRTYVRRKGERLETSRGAEVPWAHAVAVFRMAQACRAEGREWHRNGNRQRIGSFELDAIDTEGNIRVGCHTIHYSEMQALAVREVPNHVKPAHPLPALIAP